MNKTYSIQLNDLPTFAQTLAKTFAPGDCVCLTGEMGAGKTTLSYFLVQAWLGQEAAGFSSPTFTIMNQYAGQDDRVVNHVDLYRLESFAAFQDLDLLSEWENSNALTLVEWGEKFTNLKPHFTHVISLSIDSQNPEQRHIVLATMA